MRITKQKQHALTLVGVLFSFGTVCVLVLTVMGATQFPPKIEVRNQRDSPIVLSNLYVDASEPTKPKYGFTMTNVSDKPIRAYAIRDEVSFGDAQAVANGMKLSHLPSLSLLFLPNQSRQVEAGGDATYEQAVNTITLSVDFVEFTDGTHWGEDKHKSADLLAGTRAGGERL